MEFATPPPDISGNNASGAITNNVNPVNFSVPPPTYTKPIYSASGGAGKPGHPYFRPFANFARGPGGLPMTQDDFDGKRLRKSVMRKTVDYNSSIIRALEDRIWQRDFRDRRALQPEFIYAPNILPPPSYLDNPINAVTTRFVKTATNKMRCPIFTLAWTPEGRRLVTGASSGEFTLWNGLTFNFETILQAHDAPVRTMVWSHNDNWMVTGDHGGYVKYWQSNMNNVRMFQAHKEAVRGISFSPSDNKFASCSDDGTLRIWDFLRCTEEKVLRGHGADVKCVHWHPQKSLIVSGSKDNQQPIKLWDPKSGQALATLHAHKSTVMDLKWNDNGNWLVTASRDHLLKLFDLRNLREEVQVFRGHKKEASAVSWHPVHEGLFASGGSDGSILFWMVGTDKEVGGIDTAHDSIVWTLAWHPLGHILCSGSNDHTIKFWTRNRPGDQMRDKYNLNTLPPGLQSLEDCEIDESNATIPGMGPEDKVEFTESLTADRAFIPGLDLDTSKLADAHKERDKKQPYSKPIPRNFQAHWNTQNKTDDDDPSAKEFKDAISHYVENTPGVVPLQKITPSAIVVYGRMIEVKPGSSLERAISDGPESLNKFISSGEIEELNDVIPHIDDDGGGSGGDGNAPDDDDDDDDDDSQSSVNKSERFRRRIRFNQDHNAQLVFDKDVSKSLGYIPPLMALNVNVNPNIPIDIDFRANGNNNNNMNNNMNNNINSNNINNNNMNNQNQNMNIMDGGDRMNFKSNKDSMMNPWASMNQNGPSSIWDIPPAFIANNSNMNNMNNNPMNSNNMNNNNNPIAFNNNNNINNNAQMKPPSLFDIKIAPPVFDDDIIDVDIDSNKKINSNNNNNNNSSNNKSSNRTSSSSSSRSDKYRSGSPKKSDEKGRRNRDSDGKRISRFDSVENQNSGGGGGGSGSNSTSNSTSNSGGGGGSSSSSRSRRDRDSGSRGSSTGGGGGGGSSSSSSRRQDSSESRSSRRK